jgi:hypothetical protein
VFTKNAQDWKEVEKRKAHHNVTVFSPLSLEYKTKMINQGLSSNRENEKEVKEEEERLKVDREQ